MLDRRDHRPWSMARVITASSAGTAFEWYDFFIFGALAGVSRAGRRPLAASCRGPCPFGVRPAGLTSGISHRREDEV